MGKRIYFTEEQFHLLLKFTKQNGKILAKHLPLTSGFKSVLGDWKRVWTNNHGEESWPSSDKEMMSACHIIDVETRQVYLYPMKQSINASIEGHEDESFFLADKNLLVEFQLKDVDGSNLDESPEELLNRAKAQISFL